MDVVNAEQARIAEEAGACAVMARERVPADIRRDGGVARMSDPRLIKEIKAAVTIPVMAKCRVGHLVESQVRNRVGAPRGGDLAPDGRSKWRARVWRSAAQILEALGVDYVDESEV